MLGLAASGALAEFTTIRVLTASTVSFGLVSQASGRVVGELGTGWHITVFDPVRRRPLRAVIHKRAGPRVRLADGAFASATCSASLSMTFDFSPPLTDFRDEARGT